MLGSRPRRVHVVAGHGNNGGDALVASRHLAAWGCRVTAAVLADPGRLRPLMAQQCAAAAGAGVRLRVSSDPGGTVASDGATLVVDGLLGTGLSQPPRAAHAAAIAGIRGQVLSIDVPSGLNASHGAPLGAVVSAAATCTLTACKLGLWSEGARQWTGAVHVADIGMPAAAWTRCGLTAPTEVRGGALRRVPLSIGARH